VSGASDDALTNVRMALARLRGATSVTELMQRATAELCRCCGFDRSVLFRVDGSELVAECAYFQGDPAGAQDFVELARGVRPQLNHMLLETEMIRRERPVLVTDAENDPRTFKPLVQACATKSYVAAPIMPGGRVIGMLHADHRIRDVQVDERDRDVLWTFAEGFGYAVERTLLMERLEAETAQIQQMAQTAASLIEELRATELDLSPAASQSNGSDDHIQAALDRTVAAPLGLDGLLTRRELEVLELMAAGASNSEIADRLVISVGTVKSHVKHILRKLRAANRAEAVSRYFRLTAQAQNAGGL
jgi:DNA-binding CsgD family transcriptional regulator/transcriptional regulator with GAF, ATPase, and Fis domain